MKRALAVALLCLVCGPALAADKNKSVSKAKAPVKAKVYTFTGLDVEGKLKTPQILYFLGRIRLELDTTSTEKRSFMKELADSAGTPGL